MVIACATLQRWTMRGEGKRKKKEAKAVLSSASPMFFRSTSTLQELHPLDLHRREKISPSVRLRSEDLRSRRRIPCNPESDNIANIFVRGITAIAVYPIAFSTRLGREFSLFFSLSLSLSPSLSLPFREFGARTATIDGHAATDALKLFPGAFKPRLMRIALLKAGWNGCVYGHTLYTYTRDYTHAHIHPFPATVRSMHTTE